MSYIENRAEIKFRSYVGEDKLSPASREYTFLPADASSNVKVISDLYVIDGSVTDSTLTYSAQSTGILTIFVDPDATGDLTLKINGDTNGNTLAPRRIVSGAITGLTVTNGSSSTRQIISYTFIPNGTVNATDSNVTAITNNNQVKVSSNDSTENYLSSKLVAGSGITLTETNDGANETLSIAVTSGGADVVGPASATDNAIVRFDSTTGKLIQNSGVTIDDSGNIATSGTVDGRDLSTDGTKLDNIEANADVTDAANVASAGAVMDTDFSTSGLMTRTASGTYASRTATAGSTKITISNGDGVSGNPTFDVDPSNINSSALNNDAGFLANVVEDTTPQLGGDLDAQTNDITGVDNLKFSASPATPLTTEGSVYYDSTNKCLAVQNDEADSTLQVGQENWIRVYNNSGSTITNGSVVYASGKEDTEDRLTIALARADAANTSKVIGFATHDIENASFGYITQFGYVGGLNTASFSDGETIWLSDTTAGGLTNVEPESPSFSVFLGYIVDSHASTGNLFITTLGNTSGTVVAGDATQLVVPARKGTAGTITKGQVVYITGYNTGQNVVEIELADADSAATMPAIGIANDSITNSTTGNIVISGRISGIDTSSYSVGDELYVSGTAGGLTATKPTGAALIQKVAIVDRSNVSTGIISVIGAGRANDVPNFSAADKFWYGGATGTVTEGDITSAGRAILDDADASAQRTTLGLVIGTNVQAWDADLDTWATKTAPSGTVVGTTDTQTLTNKTLTTPIISSISNTGTLTLPTSTDTLVGRATTDTLTNKTLTDMTISGDVTFSEIDDGNSSTADTIDWGTGLKHKSTLTGNCTYTFTAPAGPCNLILKLVQDATGSRTVTWPASVKFPSGTAPTLSTGAGAIDIISFYYDGSAYYAQAGLNFS